MTSQAPLSEKRRSSGALGVQGEELVSLSYFGFAVVPSGSQSHFSPTRLPASVRLLWSWLSTYLNLLMKTCFTVQSTDGSSSLPKESTLTNRESELPPGDGWLGNGRMQSE